MAKAIEFYVNSGCSYIEVPWTVPEAVANITIPPYRDHFRIKSEVLVGSAEQSLLYLALAGRLIPGKRYVACTPCFRDEPVLDELHHSYFMKVELFTYSTYRSVCVDDREFFTMVAQRFFRSQGVEAELVRIDERQEDLVFNNIELGSYREAEVSSLDLGPRLNWACGTGLAEPRFSYAQSKM